MSAAVNWDGLIGHETVRGHLAASLAADRVPHAMVFSGPEGVGKRAVARAFARALVTAGDPEAESRFDRGVHDHFVAYGDLEKPLCVARRDMIARVGSEADLLEAYEILAAHDWLEGMAAAKGPDVIDRLHRNDEKWLGRKGIPFADVLERELNALERSKKSNRTALDVARLLFGAGTSRAWYRKSLGIELINGKGDGQYFRTVESLLSRSAGGGWRVAILDDAHLLTDAAENAFLKTLEEPPPNTLLLLVTAQPLSLLPTTLSRCARITFDAIPPDDLRRFLVETQGIAADEADVLTSLAEGSVGKALELRGLDFSGRLGFLERLLPAIAEGNLGKCLALVGGRLAETSQAENVREAQRREVRLALELLSLSFRDLAILPVVPEARLMSGLPADFLRPVAAQQPVTVWEALFARAELALSDVERAVEPRLAIESVFTERLPVGRAA